MVPRHLIRTFLLLFVVVPAARGGEASPGRSVLSRGTEEERFEPSPGLSVKNGEVVLQGRPFTGMGANYFSLFYRTIQDVSDTSYDEGLAQLSEAGIPFVRFMACGFWPVDWDFYRQDRERYFQCLDGVVASAEKHGMGLIPSLFWNMATVPDIVGEPMDQLGHPRSKTTAFIRQYTEEVVKRYCGSPAVWAWEFGNEYNLHVDLPNASEHRPPVWPTLKTAPQRTERDELSSAAMLKALAVFAETVRRFDPNRLLLTGHSLPRPSAYHNTSQRSWQKDSLEQFTEILLRDNPDPFDTLSVHLYPKPPNQYPAGAENMNALIATLQTASRKVGKPLFIGEFGAPRTQDLEKDRDLFKQLIQVIEANRVPLSAFWVFDHAGQDQDWNVTFDNPRRTQLTLVGAANERMRTTMGVPPRADP